MWIGLAFADDNFGIVLQKTQIDIRVLAQAIVEAAEPNCLFDGFGSALQQLLAGEVRHIHGVTRGHPAQRKRYRYGQQLDLLHCHSLFATTCIKPLRNSLICQSSRPKANSLLTLTPVRSVPCASTNAR